jgi:hypothetical protein
MDIDPQGRRVVESSAWIERMVWRTICMILFILGLILFVYSDGQWIYLALVFGGLAPGLFLMAREQGERHIEAQRAALTPEGRHSGELPPLRGPDGYPGESSGLLDRPGPTGTPPYGSAVVREPDYPAEDEPTRYR